MDPEEIGKTVREQFLRADPLRATALDALAEVRRGRAAGLRRERRRLVERHGESAPIVTAIDRRLERDRELVGLVELEAHRARASVVGVGDDEWVLHGRVLSSEFVGVPDLTVSPHDADGEWVEDLGRGCTDKDGYFRVDAQLAERHVGVGGSSTAIDPAAGDKPPGKNPDPAEDGETAANRDTDKTRDSTTPLLVHARVHDQAGTLLAVDARRIAVRPRGVDYIEIVLGDKPRECPPPPPPPRKKPTRRRAKPAGPRPGATKKS